MRRDMKSPALLLVALCWMLLLGAVPGFGEEVAEEEEEEGPCGLKECASLGSEAAPQNHATYAAPEKETQTPFSLTTLTGAFREPLVALQGTVVSAAMEEGEALMNKVGASELVDYVKSDAVLGPLQDKVGAMLEGITDIVEAASEEALGDTASLFDAISQDLVGTVGSDVCKADGATAHLQERLQRRASALSSSKTSCHPLDLPCWVAKLTIDTQFADGPGTPEYNPVIAVTAGIGMDFPLKEDGHVQVGLGLGLGLSNAWNVWDGTYTAGFDVGVSASVSVTADRPKTQAEADAAVVAARTVRTDAVTTRLNARAAMAGQQAAVDALVARETVSDRKVAAKKKALAAAEVDTGAAQRRTAAAVRDLAAAEKTVLECTTTLNTQTARKSVAEGLKPSVTTRLADLAALYSTKTAEYEAHYSTYLGAKTLEVLAEGGGDVAAIAQAKTETAVAFKKMTVAGNVAKVVGTRKTAAQAELGVLNREILDAGREVARMTERLPMKTAYRDVLRDESLPAKRAVEAERVSAEAAVRTELLEAKTEAAGIASERKPYDATIATANAADRAYGTANKAYTKALEEAEAIRLAAGPKKAMDYLRDNLGVSLGVAFTDRTWMGGLGLSLSFSLFGLELTAMFTIPTHLHCLSLEMHDRDGAFPKEFFKWLYFTGFSVNILSSSIVDLKDADIFGGYGENLKEQMFILKKISQAFKSDPVKTDPLTGEKKGKTWGTWLKENFEVSVSVEIGFSNGHGSTLDGAWSSLKCYDECAIGVNANQCSEEHGFACYDPAPYDRNDWQCRVVDECAIPEVLKICTDARQTCHDPVRASEDDPHVYGNWMCVCAGADVASGDAAAMQTAAAVRTCATADTECEGNSVCADVGQICVDPSTAPGDWRCVCVSPQEGFAVGAAAVCAKNECLAGCAYWTAARMQGPASDLPDWTDLPKDKTYCWNGLHSTTIVSECAINECETDVNLAVCADEGQTCLDPSHNTVGDWRCECVGGAVAAEPEGGVEAETPTQTALVCVVNECDMLSPCGAYQTCTDTDEEHLNSWVCECNAPTVAATVDVTGVSLVCTQDECAVAAVAAVCTAVGQTCRDPTPTPGSTGDWVCVCALPLSGFAQGAVARCSECTLAGRVDTCADAGKRCFDTDETDGSTGGTWSCVEPSAEVAAGVAHNECAAGGVAFCGEGQTCYDDDEAAAGTWYCLCDTGVGQGQQQRAAVCVLNECMGSNPCEPDTCLDTNPTAPALADYTCTAVSASASAHAAHAAATQKKSAHRAGRMAAALSDSSIVTAALEEVMTLFSHLRPILEEGKVVAPFCLGATCDDETPDTKKTVQGTALAQLTETCDALEAHVYVDELLLSNVIFVATNGVPGFGDDTVELLVAAVAGFGLQDVDVELLVGGDGFSLTGAGRVLVADVGEGLLGTVIGALAGVLEDIQVVVTVDVGFDGSASVRFEVSLVAPDTDLKDVAVVNEEGTLGLNVFYEAGTTLLGPVSTVGVSLPLKVCVEDCDPVTVDSRFIYFTGTVQAKTVMGTVEAQGLLEMEGTWDRALGLPFLHISNARLGVGASISPTLAFPTSMTVGASVCLGLPESCLETPRADANYVEAKAYLSWSAVDPQENWFVVMVSELTLEKVVHILSTEDVLPELAVFKGMPSKIGQSGIYPLKSKDCDVLGEAANTTALDKDCFAFFSLNPGTKTQTLEFADGNDIVIPRGVTLSGRLRILDFEFSIDAAFSATQLYIDAEMGKVESDGSYGPLTMAVAGKELITLGRARVDGRVVGGPKFLVDVSKTSALVNISGYLEIPMLKTYGSLVVAVNDDEFAFDAELSLFGLLSVSVKVQWDWNMTNFNFAMASGGEGGSIGAGDALVSLNSMSFVYSAEKSLARVDASITVFLTLEVDAYLEIDGNWLAFGISGKLLGATVSVDGRALLSLATPTFTLTVTFSLGETLAKIGKAVWGGIKKVGAVLTQAWDYVGEKISKITGAIKDFFLGSLKKVADAIMGVLNGIGDVLSSVVGVLRDMPLLGELVSFGEDLVKGLASVFVQKKDEHVAIVEENVFGCNVLQRKWTNCVSIVCWPKSGSKYNDTECMDGLAADAKKVENLAASGAAKEAATQDNKNTNGGFVAVLDTGFAPADPEVAVDPVFTVASGHTGAAGSTVDVSTPVLNQGGVADPTMVSSSFGVDFGAGAADLEDQAAASLSTSLAHDVQNGVNPTFSEDYADEADTTYKAYVPVLPLLDRSRLNTVTTSLQGFSGSVQKPAWLRLDERCKTGAYSTLLSSKVQEGRCGVSYLYSVWLGVDGCGQETRVTDRVTFPAEPPVFAHPFPEDFTTALPHTDMGPYGVPKAGSQYGPEVLVTYEDSLDEVVVLSASSWLLKRTWTTQLFLAEGSCDYDIMGETRVQHITVTTPPPEFVALAADLNGRFLGAREGAELPRDSGVPVPIVTRPERQYWVEVKVSATQRYYKHRDLECYLNVARAPWVVRDPERHTEEGRADLIATIPLVTVCTAERTLWTSKALGALSLDGAGKMADDTVSSSQRVMRLTHNGITLRTEFPEGELASYIYDWLYIHYDATQPMLSDRHSDRYDEWEDKCVREGMDCRFLAKVGQYKIVPENEALYHNSPSFDTAGAGMLSSVACADFGGVWMLAGDAYAPVLSTDSDCAEGSSVTVVSAERTYDTCGQVVWRVEYLGHDSDSCGKEAAVAFRDFVVTTTVTAVTDLWEYFPEDDEVQMVADDDFASAAALCSAEVLPLGPARVEVPCGMAPVVVDYVDSVVEEVDRFTFERTWRIRSSVDGDCAQVLLNRERVQVVVALKRPVLLSVAVPTHGVDLELTMVWSDTVADLLEAIADAADVDADLEHLFLEDETNLATPGKMLADYPGIARTGTWVSAVPTGAYRLRVASTWTNVRDIGTTRFSTSTESVEEVCFKSWTDVDITLSTYTLDPSFQVYVRSGYAAWWQTPDECAMQWERTKTCTHVMAGADEGKPIPGSCEHAGYLWTWSTVGKGTTFVPDTAAPPTPAPPTPAPPTLPPPTPAPIRQKLEVVVESFTSTRSYGLQVQVEFDGVDAYDGCHEATTRLGYNKYMSGAMEVVVSDYVYSDVFRVRLTTLLSRCNYVYRKWSLKTCEFSVKDATDNGDWVRATCHYVYYSTSIPLSIRWRWGSGDTLPPAPALCPAMRTRTAWSQLSCDERTLYTRAVAEFRTVRADEYKAFMDMYTFPENRGSGGFTTFAWNRWYLHGWESALRSLGGDFACVTVPYWDYHKDTGVECAQNEALRMDTSAFGTCGGVAADTHCVTDGMAAGWTLSGGAGGGCVRREFASYSYVQTEDRVEGMLRYGTEASFTEWLGKVDVRVRGLVGGTMNDFFGNTQPEDPLFFIHLANMDRLLALWQDYRGLDEWEPEHTVSGAVAAEVLNMQHAADGSVLTAYFGTDAVTVAHVFAPYKMAAGAYAYGADAIGARLDSFPMQGYWSSVIVPGDTTAVTCPRGPTGPAPAPTPTVVAYPVEVVVTGYTAYGADLVQAQTKVFLDGVADAEVCLPNASGEYGYRLGEHKWTTVDLAAEVSPVSVVASTDVSGQGSATTVGVRLALGTGDDCDTIFFQTTCRVAVADAPADGEWAHGVCEGVDTAGGVHASLAYKWRRGAAGATTLPSAPVPAEPVCTGTSSRVRTALSQLTCDKRDLYMQAVATFRATRTSEYNAFMDMHKFPENRGGAAGAAGAATEADLLQFVMLQFSWYRRYLHGWESALRSLGGAFACVTVPYWDYHKDSRLECARNEALTADAFGSCTGSVGTCVSSGMAAGWTHSADASGACITRDFATTTYVHPSTKVVDKISSDLATFVSWMANMHTRTLAFVGGTMNDTVGHTQPEDPLFFIHLANMDRLLVLWQDYQGHDEVQVSAAGVLAGLGVTDETLNMQYAADGSVLVAYFGVSDKISDVFTPAQQGISGWGGAYVYGADANAAQLGYPVTGLWSSVRIGNTSAVCTPGCERKRKAWSQLACTEGDLYTRAVAEFRTVRADEYKAFMDMYTFPENRAGSGLAMFSWNRWYLHGWESALRSLGGEFACVTVPYWDYHKDTGVECAQNEALTAGAFGKCSGVAADTHCVTEGVAAGWTLSDGSGVCVTREFGSGASVQTPSRVVSMVKYATGATFTDWLAKVDVRVQEIVGGTMNGTNTQPEDPLFFIHLANMDRLLALWQDYQGHATSSTPAERIAIFGEVDVALNMQHAADGSVLTAYFGREAVSVSDVLYVHSMVGGVDYSYGNDGLAARLGTHTFSGADWKGVSVGDVSPVCVASCSSTTSTRQAYSHTSCGARDLYTRAVAEFRTVRADEYKAFMDMYTFPENRGSGGFTMFAWNRWYLHGWESALRSLGGDFACVTVPYWDYHKDSRLECAQNEALTADAFGTCSGVAADALRDGGCGCWVGAV